MSAAPHPSDFGYAGLTMSADEFLALGETQERYELIDGVVVMSPSPTVRHNEILAEIIHQLKAYAGRTRAIRVLPETDVCFRGDKVYRPDISVYAADALPQRFNGSHSRRLSSSRYSLPEPRGWTS